MSLPKRKNTRLTNYDYSQNGAYFITICTYDRNCIFGTIVGSIHESTDVSSQNCCKLSDCGKYVKDIIDSLEGRYINCKIDNYVIMPNHVHLLIEIIDKSDRAIHESPPQYKRSELSKIIGYLKMNSSKKIHALYPELKIWQRSYHDHIIRNEKSYQEIWQYIDTNALKWELDCFYTVSPVPKTNKLKRRYT